jgi:hypothetical protein
MYHPTNIEWTYKRYIHDFNVLCVGKRVCKDATPTYQWNSGPELIFFYVYNIVSDLEHI